MNRTTETECPLGDCCGEGEYIPCQTDFKGNNLELDQATTSDSSRRFNCLQDLCIHKAHADANDIILLSENVNRMMRF